MIKHPAITFEHVSKSFALSTQTSIKYTLAHLGRHAKERVQVVNNVTFDINQGETVGMFGPNGSGKSTILRLISKIILPDSGNISVHGKLAPVIELGSGLHPELTGIENIYLYSAILGMSKQHLSSSIKDIISFSELSKFINVPIKRYSSGMKSRLAFSVAIFSDAEIFLFDEIFAVGDISFTDKGMRLLDKMKKSRTILFTSHNLNLLQHICDRVLIFDNGALLNEQNEALIAFLLQMPRNHQFIAEAKSNSMYPLIKKTDLITIKRIEFDRIQAGDIIAFYLSHIPEIVVHRVIDTTTDYNEKVCITKGDNALGLDTWKINGSTYIGKVTKIESKTRMPVLRAGRSISNQ